MRDRIKAEDKQGWWEGRPRVPCSARKSYRRGCRCDICLERRRLADLKRPAHARGRYKLAVVPRAASRGSKRPCAELRTYRAGCTCPVCRERRRIAAQDLRDRLKGEAPKKLAVTWRCEFGHLNPAGTEVCRCGVKAGWAA